MSARRSKLPPPLPKIRNGIWFIPLFMGLEGWMESDAPTVHDHNMPAVKLRGGKVIAVNKAAQALGFRVREKK